MIVMCLVVALSQAPSVSKAAVLGVRAETGIDKGVGSLMTSLLTQAIAESGKYQVISTDELAVLLGVERQRVMAGCEESSCAAEIGSALGADKLFSGTLGALGNLRVLTLTLLDASKGIVEARQSVTVDDERQLPEAVKTLTAKLIGAPAEPPRSSGVRPGWWVLGGAAVLGVVGGIFGITALSQYGTYKASSDAGREDLHRSARLMGGVADGFYAAAVVTAAIAAVLLVLGRSP